MDQVDSSVHIYNDRITLVSRFAVISSAQYSNSFDNVRTSGLYYCHNFQSKFCMLIVIASASDVKQIRFSNNTNLIEQRFYWNSSWSNWSTIVSS